MGKEPTHRDWVKLWVKECLIGSMREELTPEERGVWYDFLILAGHSRIPGVICANGNTPLSVKRIGEILNTPLTLIEHCITVFIKADRIVVDEYGCIHLNNWDKYQYSDYDRQKPFREKGKLTEEQQEVIKTQNKRREEHLKKP
jgi:hypothetical protein